MELTRCLSVIRELRARRPIPYAWCTSHGSGDDVVRANEARLSLWNAPFLGTSRRLYEYIYDATRLHIISIYKLRVRCAKRSIDFKYTRQEAIDYAQRL